MSTWRLGSFSLPRNLLVELGQSVLQDIFKDVVVLQTDYMLSWGATRYLALHPSFEPVAKDSSSLALEYEVLMECDADGNRSFKCFQPVWQELRHVRPKFTWKPPSQGVNAWCEWNAR